VPLIRQERLKVFSEFCRANYKVPFLDAIPALAKPKSLARICEAPDSPTFRRKCPRAGKYEPTHLFVFGNVPADHLL
jgi:hypothetical protein